MKILVLSNLYPPHYIGGYELRCRDITESLRDRGHQMHVLTSDHRESGISDAAGVAGYSVERTLRVHGAFGHPWLGIRELRDLESHNNAILRDAVSRFRPDVVHVWNLGGISKSLALTLQDLGVPSVFDVSDHWIAQSLKADVWLDWWNRDSPSLAARVARSAWTIGGHRSRLQQQAPTNPVKHLKFRRLYFCSRRLREITAEQGYAVSHGEVIHCPVNLEAYDGEPKPATAPLKKLLYAGRLAEDKGILTALRAMTLLKEKFDGTLSVYGRGTPAYEKMLRDYVSEHDLPVSFFSATPLEMPSVYRAHDALLFTSEWEEPFALTPLEAMASGLPVIGTTTGGSAELFRHGQNALTYQAGDAWELSECVAKMTSQPEWRTQMARTARQEVRQKFSLPLIVTQVEKYLQESVKTWQPAGLPHYLAA